MWRIFLRPAMIVVPLFIGLLFPEAHKLAYAPVNAVRWALCVMIFNAALQIELADLKLRKEHFLILGANIFMGIVPFFVLYWLFPGHKEYALAAFFAGITPTAAASAVIISLLGGKIGFALSGFALTNVGISLAMIGLLPLTTGNFTLDFCWSVAKTLALVMLLPITAAQVTRKLISSVEKIRGKLKHITLCIWSFCLFVLGAVARQYFVDHPGESFSSVAIVGIISLVICVANFYFGGKICRGEFQQECSQLLGQKNTVYSIYLALNYASGLVALGLVFYVVWHNVWNAWQLFVHDRQKLTSSDK